MLMVRLDQRVVWPIRRRGMAACRIAMCVDVILLSTMLALGTRAGGGTPGVGGPDPNYDRAVRPILSQRCAECHFDDELSSGFSIASRATVIAGGDKYGRAVFAGSPARSPLVKVLRGTLKPRMPLHGKMDENEIARIEDWIKNLPPDVAEATDAKAWRWPFETPVKVQPPAGPSRNWVITPIDAFILEKPARVGRPCRCPRREAGPGAPRVRRSRWHTSLAGRVERLSRR